MNWEETFNQWSKPPGKTEQDKMDNAETAIKKAIAKHDRLSNMDITVSTQGSYQANTNVTQDSDVDVCVRLNSTFFVRYPEGKNRENYGNIAGSISFSTYKDLVHEALNDHFGVQYVTHGDKAFYIHSNSYRVDADVLPAFAYRYYYGDSYEDYIQPVGVAFIPDKGGRIENWPDQTYSNGVDKNKATSLRYKKIIRIIKNLRNEMQEEKINAANNIASFLIESLVWNTPDNYFNCTNYTDDVKNVLAHTFNATMSDEKCDKWYEVNEIKYLFRLSQPWSRIQAHNFLLAAWDYIGFE